MEPTQLRRWFAHQLTRLTKRWQLDRVFVKGKRGPDFLYSPRKQRHCIVVERVVNDGEIRLAERMAQIAAMLLGDNTAFPDTRPGPKYLSSAQ